MEGVQLLRRRTQLASADTAGPEPRHSAALATEDSSGRRLERLSRWIESENGDANAITPESIRPEERMLVAGRGDRLGKVAVQMVAAEGRKKGAAAARVASGEIARKASARVARLFAERGQQKALLATARVPHRTLARLTETLPRRIEAHILEHTREIAGKPAHTLFAKGMATDDILDLVRATLRSGAPPILSVSDNGALVFVFEKEFSKTIGAGGEKLLRVVVDLDGRLVTSFPIAIEKKLATLSIRGITVTASLAHVVFLSALAQAEEEVAVADAARRRAKAERSTWYEELLSVIGPFNLFDSSPIAIDPPFSTIRRRTEAALEEARTSLQRELTAEERQAIQRCVYDVWAQATYSDLSG